MFNKNKPITRSDAKISLGVAIAIYVVGFYFFFSGIVGSWLIGDGQMYSGDQPVWIAAGIFLLALASCTMYTPFKALRYMDIKHVDYVYRSDLKTMKNGPRWTGTKKKQRVNGIPRGFSNGRQVFECSVCHQKIAVTASAGKHIIINCPCGRELDART